MLLKKVEKGIRGRTCHVIHRYAKANNKYMKNYDKNKESSYIQYLDANNLYRWSISQKLPVDGFKWKTNILKFNEDFIKNCDEDSDKEYVFEGDVEYPINLHNPHSDFSFLAERMKINNCSKLVYALYDKGNYIVHIRMLKQTLNHGLILKKYTGLLNLMKKHGYKNILT